MLATLSITVHSDRYSATKSYSHRPLANPATHAQRYASGDTSASVVESVHVAPFWHGPLAHSLAGDEDVEEHIATLQTPNHGEQT